ncbi:GTP 3',8-cyclase MoaA [Lysinibacter sp. HNR]|uniref:GTP 3',8-cyclase MoaA n=1 Tax=Lysinibacter sp. HNR TaxID=3031408 RepID=UPI00243577FA|nr:GTP 3',8-cyclase MoaA [Lysinibacter sp. HNR]WGD36571.1 GTP 3',8-cyclase MoaA [Lysinibacter sp. HNR]
MTVCDSPRAGGSRGPVPLTLTRRPGSAVEYVRLSETAVQESGAAADKGGLVDRFGRVHRDLRISLTDKCSLRCTYCMPEEGVPWLAKSSILTSDELERVVRVAASLGITSIRLTGGEPLLRQDIVDVVRRIARIEGESGPLGVAMTTNGIRLPALMDDLVAAGLQRVNISLDTLRRDRFHELTRRDKLAEVLAGIEVARLSGLAPLKINAVAMRGVNDDELADLVAFALENNAQMRFIEQMPLDAGHTWSRVEMVSGEEILESLRARFTLTPVPQRGAAPAELWYVNGTESTVGVIASVTAPFCHACDRVRLTADGQLRNCLFSRTESNLIPLVRGGATDEDIAALMRRCITGKLPGHGINDPGFLQPDRPMNAIGG